MVDLKTRPPHMCYHAEFGRCELKGVGINTGEPKNWGSAGTRALLGLKAWLTPRHTPSSTRVITSNLVISTNL